MKPIIGIPMIVMLALVSGCMTDKNKNYEGMRMNSTCNEAKTHDWHAWNNMMPGGPKSVHVTGSATVNSGGWTASLTKAAPQGINPEILMLNLEVTPPGGIATQPMLELPLSYSEDNANNKKVQVRCGNKLIADLLVEDVH